MENSSSIYHIVCNGDKLRDIDHLYAITSTTEGVPALALGLLHGKGTRNVTKRSSSLAMSSSMSRLL